MFRNLGRDLYFALRSMRAQPVFFAVAILALGLGIGAATAIFTVINTVVLNPVPFSEPDRIACLYERHEETGLSNVSAPDFREWRQKLQSFEVIGASRYDNFNIADSDQPERVRASLVSAGLFEVLQVRPIRGRTIRLEDEAATAGPVVVMGYALWQRRYNRDESVLGRSIRINGQQYTVVGIMPPNFEFPNSGLSGSELWAPLVRGPRDQSESARAVRQLMVFGRLKRNASLAQAQAELQILAKQIAAEHAASNNKVEAVVRPLSERIAGGNRDLLYALLGIVGCVLLIACANVANLLIARSNARRREIAIRSALGASRGRLFAQMMAECGVLAIAGLLVGIVVAYFARNFLSSLVPPILIGQRELELSLPVLLFSFLLSTATLLLFGLIPALGATRVDLQSIMNEGARHTGSVASAALRSGLVTLEIALSMVLLTVSAALIGTFYDVLAISPGFQPDHILTMRLTLPVQQYGTDESKVAFHNKLIETLAILPGVRSVVLTNAAPLRDTQQRRYYIEAGPRPEPGREPVASFHAVSAGYFETLGMKIEAGRVIQEHDREGSPAVAVLSTSAGKQMFGHRNPIGENIILLDPAGTGRMANIVGVVADVRQYGPLIEASPQIYVPYRQFPTQRMDLLVRTQMDSASIVSAIRRAVSSLNRDVPAYNIATMDHLLNESISEPEFNMLLVCVLAAIALVLATIGVAGLLAYVVTLRRHEIAIRSALGADRRSIAWLFLRYGGTLGGVGVLLGAIFAIVSGKAAATLLFGIRSIDALAVSTAGLLLLTASIAASIVPAMRAAKTSPMSVLRNE